MSKERLKEVDRWLLSMKDILSSKTEEKEIEEVQQRIDLFEWLREQAFAVHGGETFTGYKEQNKRYREALEIIADKREVDFGNSYTNKAYNHSRKIARKALESDSDE